MKLYWIPSENRFVRTQGEARKLGFGDETEFPTDKDGLIEQLNELHRQLANWQQRAIDATPVGRAEAEPEPVVDRQAAVMKQIEIEEAIQSADAATLARYADNVCWRIKELVQELEKR